MNELWTPENSPPQVSPKARDKVTELVYSGSFKNNWNTYAFLFRSKHYALRDYMSVFGTDETGEFYGDPRPVSAFRVGGVLAGLAYLESGYDQGVDMATLELGLLDAEIEGIPEAYVVKLSDDHGLQQLIESVSPVTDLSYGVVDDESYRGAMELGAGCVRHYLQTALAA